MAENGLRNDLPVMSVNPLMCEAGRIYSRFVVFLASKMPVTGSSKTRRMRCVFIEM